MNLFFFFLVSPYQTIEISLGQPSPPSYQLLAPPLLYAYRSVRIDIIASVLLADRAVVFGPQSVHVVG